jgi:hypothetical protein
MVLNQLRAACGLLGAKQQGDEFGGHTADRLVAMVVAKALQDGAPCNA